MALVKSQRTTSRHGGSVVETVFKGRQRQGMNKMTLISRAETVTMNIVGMSVGQRHLKQGRDETLTKKALGQTNVLWAGLKKIN